LGAAIPEGSLVGASVLKELHLKPLSKSLSQPPFSKTIKAEIVLANLLLSSKRAGKETRMERVKEIHHVVGISCHGFKEQFMAKLTAIAASRSNSNMVNIGN
jgi:hypothetical protein